MQTAALMRHISSDLASKQLPHSVCKYQPLIEVFGKLSCSGTELSKIIIHIRTRPSTLPIFYDTLPLWLRLHPPLRGQRTQRMWSENKCIILLNSSTPVPTEAVPPPIAARVIPLTGVVDRYAEHVWRWRHIAKDCTCYVRCVLSLFNRTTRVSVVTVRDPDITCHYRLCVLTHTIDWPTLAWGWCGGFKISHWTAKLGATVISFKVLNRGANPSPTATIILDPFPTIVVMNNKH